MELEPLQTSRREIYALISNISVASSSNGPSSSTLNIALIAACLQGFLENASGPRCHFPGLYEMENLYGIVFPLRLTILELEIVLRSLSLRIPNKGRWSVETVNLSHPRTKNFAWPSPQAAANSSFSVGT